MVHITTAEYLTTSKHPSSGRAVKKMSDTRECMIQALDMAKLARTRREVPVGCVVVHNDSIVAKGCNEVNATMNATRHAEMIAIDQLLVHCRSINIQLETFCSKCTMYVTVEPCIMCAHALRLCGLTDIVFGCHNERFGGCGSVFNVHEDPIGVPMEMVISSRVCRDILPKLSVTCGIMKEEAVALLQEFYNGENQNAPEEKRKRKNKELSV